MNERDIACIGGHMGYCETCKYERRWRVVGEFPASERPVETIIIRPDVCMLTKGSRYIHHEPTN